MSAPAGFAERLRRLPAGGKIVLAFVVAIVALNAIAWTLDRAVGGEAPGGATSSSLATADDGLAAYASLLGRFDVDVERQRGALGDADLDPASTLLLLDPVDLTSEDGAALRRFVERGGHLVAGGQFPGALLTDVLADPPEWEGTGSTEATSLGREPGYDGIDDVRTTGAGSFSDSGDGTAVVGGDDGALVVINRAIGDGSVLALADASPLQNQLLAEADNAALGLALVESTPTVVFAEGVHGLGETTGVAAIPTGWKVALAGLVLAGLVAVWARARRLGPPEQHARPLPPPRAAYVEALAATLARTDRPAAALGGLRTGARERLRRRTGLSADADEEALRAAAGRLGWPNDEIDGVCGNGGTETELAAAGRALARLERGEA